MKAFATPGSQARSAARAIRSSAAMMLFATDGNDPRGWVNLGRSFERVAITATTLDIKHAHLNMPCEVPSLREELRRHLDLGDAHPLLLLRIGYGKPMPRAPRRSLGDVVVGRRDETLELPPPRAEPARREKGWRRRRPGSASAPE